MNFVIITGGYLGFKSDWPGYELPVGYFPFGVDGMLVGASTVFFAYIGFDSVASKAEEVKNMQRDLPLAMCRGRKIWFIGERFGSGVRKYSAPIHVTFLLVLTQHSAHHRLLEHSRFLFIPEPNDVGHSTVLPRPPLPNYLTEELQKHVLNALFLSNPCRIKFYTQEIVFFRQDLLYRMRRSCLMPPSSEEISDPFEHLVATITHQSHLCPLPLSIQPVIWNYDHCLHLYPTPHTPRILMEMGRDGLLPSFLSEVNKRTQVPVKSTILTGIIVAALSFFMDVEQLAGMVSLISARSSI